MPLIICNIGENVIVEKISGKDKKHFENLGIIPGSELNIVSKNVGGLIIDVKGSRLAICPAVAKNIFCHIIWKYHHIMVL